MNMKRIKLKLATAIFLGSLMSSCYEDKGNYDYEQMNDITVEIPLESSDCVLGDVLKIIPELKFSTGKETENLTYLWTFDGQEIATERVLNWTVDKDGKYKDLRLAVKDQTTGVTYFGSALLSVISPYTTDGWVTLSAKEDGTSMLTYMRPTTKDQKYTCVVTKDVYGLSNGGATLGGKPIFMSQHFVSPWGSGEDNTSWLWITQQGGQGCVDVSGSSYQTEGYLPAMFINGGYPQGFEPQRVYDMVYLSMAIGRNGEIYTRVKESLNLFNSNYFLDDRVLLYNGQPIDGTMIAMTPEFYEHGGVLAYDKNSNRYLHITDLKASTLVIGSGMVDKYYSGNVLALETWDSSDPFDDMTGYTVHYIGACVGPYGQGGGSIGYMSVIEKDSRFFIQHFEVDDCSGKYAHGAYITTPLREVPFADIVNASTKNVYALCYYQNSGRPYLLLSSDNDLYLYYFNGDKGKQLIKFATFDAPITGIDTGGGAYEGHAGVGLENGEFYVLDLSLSVLEEIIKEGDSEKKVLFKEEGLGKIVQVLYKRERARDYGSWD